MRITIEIDEGAAVSTRSAVTGAGVAVEVDGGAATDGLSKDRAESIAARDATEAGGPPDWLLEAIAVPVTDAAIEPPQAFEELADGVDGGSAPDDGVGAA